MLREAANRREERRFDREHGIDTAGRQSQSEEVADHCSRAEAVHYQGASPARFRELVDALDLDRAATTFVDLGCGKGKVLVLAVEAGFGHVVGVEFDPGLAAAAERNLRAFCDSRGGPSFEVRCEDAGSTALPPGPLLVFLFNPFGPSVISRVIDALPDSAGDGPVIVLYLNPVQRAAFEAAPRLRPLPLGDDLLCARSLPLFRRILGHERGSDLAARAYELV